ncbi:MAG: hypothetical protein Q9160_007369 [Pyrenula sp. 1 TL-2023]
MAEYKPDTAGFAKLREKVVVITGGSTGIGAALVSLLHRHGAFIVFGDTNLQAGEALAARLNSFAPTSSSSPPKVLFLACDVTSYSSIYALFKTARDTHGHIDHAVPCAGILEQGAWFDPELTVESVAREETMKVLQVDLVGVCWFARIGAVFLREGKGEAVDRSLLLMSSVNAFRESPGLFMYQAAKHGVLGLLRSTRKILYERDHIRVNAICPGITDTPMSAPFIDTFKQPGLAWQSAEDVARVILGLLTSTDVTGKAFYVEGTSAWEFEDGFYQSMPQWLGEQPTRMLRANAEHVSKVRICTAALLMCY